MSSNKWAYEKFSESDPVIIKDMLFELETLSGKALKDPSLIKLKRWKYANAQKQEEILDIIDYSYKLAVCGDWCISGRIESAFMSSLNLSTQLLKSITSTE